ncbi:MAG: glycosyltransferase [Verrucomicrobia bacterium]|nr:glycosyltransferase [Verrucomicrobiota bacterium]
MRVLHVIPSLAIGQGGPTVAMGVIERALLAEGVDVETVTTDDDGRGVRNGKGNGQPISENGCLRRYFRKNTEFYTVSISMTRWLSQEVRNYDLVHIHALFSFASIAAGFAARRAGVPFLFRPFGVLNRYGVTQRRPFLKKLSLRWVEGPLLTDAAAIHFTSKDEAEQAAILGIPFRSVILPLGLEAMSLPTPAVDAAPTILYLSRLNPVKNLESLLQAWASLAARFKEWRLVIAGSGEADYQAQLRALAGSLALGDQVQWMDHVSGDQKAQLLADASIFVLPSFSENFGLAAAEALLAGKACLLTPGVAIAADAAAAQAAVIAGPDSASMADALEALMTSPERRQDLSAHALKYASEELSTQRMGRRLVELYEGILAKG